MTFLLIHPIVVLKAAPTFHMYGVSGVRDESVSDTDITSTHVTTIHNVSIRCFQLISISSLR